MDTEKTIGVSGAGVTLTGKALFVVPNPEALRTAFEFFPSTRLLVLCVDCGEHLHTVPNRSVRCKCPNSWLVKYGASSDLR